MKRDVARATRQYLVYLINIHLDVLYFFGFNLQITHVKSRKVSRLGQVLSLP